MDRNQFIRAVDAAVNGGNDGRLAELTKLFTLGDPGQKPFQAALRFVGAQNEANRLSESDSVTELANYLSRSWRALRYRRRMADNYNGPRIVSEGDSWLQYPFFLDDIIDVLGGPTIQIPNVQGPYAIRSLGGGGHELAAMVAEKEYVRAIEEEEAAFFIFSAAGNDVFGDGRFEKLINADRNGDSAADILNDRMVDDVLEAIRDRYRIVIGDVTAINPHITMLIHGYGNAHPRPGGPWIGNHFAAGGVPAALQFDVIRLLADKLNGMMAGLEKEYPGTVCHVDCRTAIGDDPGAWYDEIHPDNPTFLRIGHLFHRRILAEMDRQPRHYAVAHASGAGHPASLQPVQLGLPPSRALRGDVRRGADGRLQFDWGTRAAEALRTVPPDPDAVQMREQRINAQAFAHYLDLKKQLETEDQPKETLALQGVRKALSAYSGSLGFERTIGQSNFFPINYLQRGAMAARSVCRISLRGPSGIPYGGATGFMVAPGLLLTNNHVLPSVSEAEHSHAMFDYAEDWQFETMPIQRFDFTPDIFFTSSGAELDFTFISVAGTSHAGVPLAPFGVLTLVEPSGKALPKESVSIIQHPEGRMKQIALRDSTVLGRVGDYVYYTTDTEPGSSGAPVLNDEWLPVALHHRAVPDIGNPGLFVANRGIRISSIFAKLRVAAEEGDAMASAVLRALGARPREGASGSSWV